MFETVLRSRAWSAAGPRAKMRGWTGRRGPALLCAALWALQACSQDGAQSHAHSCARDSCAADAPVIDFGADKTAYSAHVRVVDGSGAPVQKARVEAGAYKASTDADGRAQLKNLSASRPTVLKVTSEKGAQQLVRTDAWKAGQTTQNISMVPLVLDAEVDLEQPLVVQKDFGRLSMDERSLARPDGTRAQKANLQLADLLPTEKARDAWLHDLRAVDKRGAPTVLKRLDAMSQVRFESDTGQALDLAATKVATLELKLARDSTAKVGDTRALWSLDEKSLTLREESSCTVTDQTLPGESGALVCKGHVTHFSTWAVADAPEAPLACLDVRPAAAHGACFRVEVESIFLLACDEAGEQCSERAYVDALFSPGEAGLPAYCGVVEASPTFRAAVLYDADVSGCAHAAELSSGRRIKLSEPFTAEGGIGKLLEAFADDPAAVCRSDGCTALALAIDNEDLSAALLQDRDDDGHYARTDGADTLFPSRSADCDDGDPETHPGAPELFCGSVDRDCDGQAPLAAADPNALDDAAQWNAACALCGASISESPEVPGNLLDEDCDGNAQDRDSDGRAEPDDCDDYDAAVVPGAREIPGNPLDEDCDGASVDWDGDGMPAVSHLYLAEALSIDPALFVDCDDYDAATHPGASDAAHDCSPEPAAVGCGAFPWSGVLVQTSCEEAIDQGKGTGTGVCVFDAWPEASPLSFEPGKLWGPCDGGAALAECADDAQCGGPLAYSAALIDYLESRHTHGAAITFQGMCFPKCRL